MKKRLKKKVEKQETLIQRVDVFLVNNYLQTKCTLAEHVNKNDYTFAFYIYKIGVPEAVAKSKYTKFDTNQVRLSAGGSYRVKVFVKHNETNEVITKISSPVRQTKIINI